MRRADASCWGKMPKRELRNLGLCLNFLINLLGHFSQVTFPLCDTVVSSVKWDS